MAVIPPRAVKIPLAACIPCMSSGEVSTLTKIVFCIISFNFSASSDVKTTFPLAAPGDAGKPFAMTLIELFSSNVGCKVCLMSLDLFLTQLVFLKLIFL